jgi:hypothetical protein
MKPLALIALSGCSFGMGSAYVGQWSPKQEVEFEACLVADAPVPDAPATSAKCLDKKEVVRAVPGRKFWGVILSLLQMGGSRVQSDGETSGKFRITPSVEYLQGRGRWALGVRVGALVDSNVGEVREDKRNSGAGAATVALLGHVSIQDQLSLYGGVGYLPYAANATDHTFLGVQGLGGFQYALSKTQSETFIVLSFEVDHTYLQLGDGYRSTGFTGHFGIFF